MKHIQLLGTGFALLCLNASITSANATSTALYGNLGTVSTTITSSTSNTVGYLSPSQPNAFQAQGFSLGAVNYELTSLEFGLSSTDAPAPVAQLFSDNSAAPDSALATFTLSGAVNALGIYTFTGSFAAQKNTSYWVVLSNANATSGKSFEWHTNDAFSTPVGLNASSITYQGTMEKNNVGGTWTNAIPSLSVRVSGTAVPEPSAFALLGLGTVGLAARRRRTA